MLRKYYNFITRVFLRNKLEKFPKIYIFIQSLRLRNKKNKEFKLFSKKTDLILEGYPRSANSFAIRAFKFPKKNIDLNISNHLHSIAHIRLGIINKLPVIMLIRNPIDAVVSLNSFRTQVLIHRKQDPKTFFNSWDIKWDFINYINFYKSSLGLTDKMVIANFDDVTKDFGKIIIQVNKKFNKSYGIFEHKKINEKQIFKNSWFHLSPNNDRNKYKNQIKKIIKEKRMAKIIKESLDLYNLILEKR